MERVFSLILIVAVAAYPLDKTADAIDRSSNNITDAGRPVTLYCI